MSYKMTYSKLEYKALEYNANEWARKWTEACQAKVQLQNYVEEELGKAIEILDRYYMNPEYRDKAKITLTDEEKASVIKQVQKVYYAVHYHITNHTPLPSDAQKAAKKRRPK